MTKKERIARRISLIICETIVAFSFIYSVCTQRVANDTSLALLTFVLVLLPEMFERVFSCRVCLPAYIFGNVYAISHMCGHIYCLYDIIPFYDKILHTVGGVVFAVVGIFLVYFFSGKKTQPFVLTAVFALCFSIAVSVAWEFFEFGSDILLGTDMQRDTVVTAIHSYKLGAGVGEVGSIVGIGASSVNDIALPFDGYLDIGLIDTMLDMLLEALGAFFVSVIYLIDKGKHPLISASRETPKNT